MKTYFENSRSLEALDYAFSMINFMDKASSEYLKTIGASNFDYIEYHENGDVLNLTNNRQLLIERFKRQMKYKILFSDIVFSMDYHQPKIFLWPDDPHNSTLEILFELDVWNGCNIFIRKENKIIVFSFSGTRSSSNIRSRCNNNQRNLFLFIHHFTLLIESRFKSVKPKYILTDIYFETPENYFLKNFEIDHGIILTNHELKVAKYISSGYSATYIADKFNVSHRTIETHTKNIKDKIYNQTHEKLSKQGLIDYLEAKRWILGSVT